MTTTQKVISTYYTCAATCLVTSFMLMTGCTMSFSNVHTDGTATGVADETQTPQTTVDPDVSVPVSLLPSRPAVKTTTTTTIPTVPSVNKAL